MNRRITAVALAALALCGSFALSGCSVSGLISAISGGDGTRDDGGEIVEEGDLDVMSLKVGDCFNEVTWDGDETTSVPAVPCDEPHIYEAFYEYSLPGGIMPTDDELAQSVDETCTPAFGDFVGLSYDESTLDYFYFSPTQEGWDDLGDRVVTCVIGTEGVEVTGSAQGSAR